MKNQFLKELVRKSIHICGALTPLLCLYSKKLVIVLLLIALVIYSVSELFRLNGHPVPVISRITLFAARERDNAKFVLGPVTLCVGILLALIIFPLNIATLAIFALCFGDGVASLVGRFWGRHKVPHSGGKTLEGSFACFLGVFISCWIYSSSVVKSLDRKSVV